MPSIGSGLSGMLHNGYEGNSRCSCCPYGYHIDVDFVPFTKKMLSRDSEVERLEALKDKWRSERQSMDKLLGVPKSMRQQQYYNHQELQQEEDAAGWSESFQSGSEEHTSSWISQVKSVQELEIIHHHRRNNIGQTTPDNSLSSSRYEDILGNGLTEAVTDFEEALSRTRPEARTLSYSIPDSQKFHTFPRIKPGNREGHQQQQDLGTTLGGLMSSSNYLSNKGSTTSTSASTVIMKETSVPILARENKLGSNGSLQFHHPAGGDSIYNSQNFQLNGVRKDGENEKRLEYLEDQVKIIPELEVKLTLLKEEKRQLMKLLENEKQKSAKLEDLVSNNNVVTPSKRESPVTTPSPVAPPRRKTRDAGVGRTIITRDVGISPTVTRTRSVGVGGNLELLSQTLLERSSSRTDSSSPTGSIPATLRRRVRNFDVGVQVKEHDFKGGSPIRILQIEEKVDIGVQTVTEEDSPEKSLAKPRIITKNSSVLAKPKTGDTGCTAKPTCKDVGVSSMVKDVRTIGVATTPAPEPPPAEKPAPKKFTKTLGVNTESPRRKTTGTNTVPMEKERTPYREGSLPKLSTSVESLRLGTPDPAVERLSTPTPVPQEEKRMSPVPRPTTPSTPSSVTPCPAESKMSKIPRLATSPSSPKSPVRKVDSKGDSSSPLQLPEEKLKEFDLDDRSTSLDPVPSTSSASSFFANRKPIFQRSDTFTKEIHFPISRFPPSQLEPLEEEDKERPSTSGSFVSLQEPREKAVPTKEMQGALKVLNDALLRGRTTQQVTSAISIILHEWFRVAGTKTANPLDVEDYLDFFESYSPQLLRYIVNMPDGNGNTAMHYAVSHGNFDVVSILLDSKVCDPNKANKAGYTSVMLVSLAKILTETHRQVVRRLFSLGDVNIKAAQHGQTALMLGASHGRLDTVKLLIEAGADVNIQDEDGSTALMCAAEHGHGDIVKYLLAQPDCDPNITDNDGSTALSVAMEAGHKDIGVMLYAHIHFLKGPPPSLSNPLLAKRSRSTTPSSQASESPGSSSHTSPLVAKKQHSSIN